MSNPEIENYEDEGGALAPEETTEEASWALSQDDWNSLVESNKQLQKTTEQLGMLVTSLYEPEEEEYEEQLDPQEIARMRRMEQVIDDRFGRLAPYLGQVVKDQGTKQLEDLMDQHENALKKEFPDGFDRKLAQRAAYAFFDENGNDAEKAVEDAARYAAEVRREERAAVASRPKREPQGDLDEFGVSGGGTRSAPRAKTYDEVIEKYAAQSEV